MDTMRMSSGSAWGEDARCESRKKTDREEKDREDNGDRWQEVWGGKKAWGLWEHAGSVSMRALVRENYTHLEPTLESVVDHLPCPYGHVVLERASVSLGLEDEAVCTEERLRLATLQPRWHLPRGQGEVAVDDEAAAERALAAVGVVVELLAEGAAGAPEATVGLRLKVHNQTLATLPLAPRLRRSGRGIIRHGCAAALDDVLPLSARR